MRSSWSDGRQSDQDRSRRSVCDLELGTNRGAESVESRGGGERDQEELRSGGVVHNVS